MSLGEAVNWYPKVSVSIASFLAKGSIFKPGKVWALPRLSSAKFRVQIWE